MGDRWNRSFCPPPVSHTPSDARPLMNQAPPLRFEILEDRTVPALFGNAWAEADRLTLSFVPDATVVDGQSSNLFAAMKADGLSVSAWQTEILRAVQAWS